MAIMLQTFPFSKYIYQLNPCVVERERMDYQQIYQNLIEKARSREFSRTYMERHHILPRALGGTNAVENIALLTLREHFIAHLLLAKLHPKMVRAAFMMSNFKKYNSKDYRRLRSQYVAQLKGRPFYEFHNLTTDQEEKRSRNISVALKGKKHTKVHSQNVAEARKRNGTYSQEVMTRDNKGTKNPMYGRTHLDDARRRISEGNKQQVECPYCSKVGAISIMQRWHFSNCKERFDRHFSLTDERSFHHEDKRSIPNKTGFKHPPYQQNLGC